MPGARLTVTKTKILETNLMGPEASIHKAADNTNDYSDDVCDPVVHVGAAVEAGLNEFNDAAEGARANEDRQQPNAARAGQREGQHREGDEVDEFVAALRRRGRRLQGPEHRDGQGERHGERQGDVEVLAHLPGCSGRAKQRQARAIVGHIHGKVESDVRSGAWGFR